MSYDPYDAEVERQLELEGRWRSEGETMTLAEARRALAGPLRFGDDAQIKAVRFLEKVDACVEEIKQCTDYAKHKRAETKGFFKRQVIACGCASTLKNDVLNAALARLTEKLYE